MFLHSTELRTLYTIIAAVFNFNEIIKYATRFTDEIFALLISTIFIIDALGSPFQPVGLYYYFERLHKSHEDFEDDPDYSYLSTAFLSLILGLGTCILAFVLKGLKFSSFFCNASVRTSVADFAVTASILSFTFLDKVVFNQVETEKLNVPDSFSPTFNCCTSLCNSFFPDDCPDQAESYGRRNWVVDLFDLNGKSYIPFIAALPALLAFVLVFLDDGITWHLSKFFFPFVCARYLILPNSQKLMHYSLILEPGHRIAIVNHPSHKLTHGESYNYDTLVVGLMIGINSIFGLPWLVAATVRSLNHLHALGNKLPDGKFIDVQETRLTNLLVHVLVLVSIFALGVIKLIPVPVLYGVFLYMGVVSLGTNQFWGRIVMFFMEPGRYPEEVYTKHISPRRMHLYTLIQLCLFALLYAVKSWKAVAIAFPVIIAACIPVRLYILPKIFTKDELILLDSEDEEIEEWIRKEMILSDEVPADSDVDAIYTC